MAMPLEAQVYFTNGRLSLDDHKLLSLAIHGKPFNPGDHKPPRVSDLSGRPHGVQVNIINHAIRQHNAFLQGEIPPYLQQHIQKHIDRADAFRRFVDASCPETTEVSISDKYKNADEKTKGFGMEEKAAQRLAEFGGVQFAIDVDGTLTENPDSEYLINNLPGSAIGEEILRQKGRKNFAEAHERSWRYAHSHVPHLFREAGSRVPIRKGVDKFFKDAKNNGIEINVVSANYNGFVEGVLDQIPNAQGVNMWTVIDESVIPTDKEYVVRHLALSEPNKALIYIGDGESDLPTIAKKAKGLIAFYFALEGSSFAKALKEKGLTYFTYEDFNDISQIMQRVASFRIPVSV